MGKLTEDRIERLATPRLARELKTIRAMLRIACHDHHGTAEGLCADCAALAEYAAKRLALCPYGADKPTCVNCQIHCYGRRQREQVRDTMRYAGPRMMLRHPYLAVMHVVDGRRPAPPKPNASLASATPSSDETAESVAAAADEAPASVHPPSSVPDATRAAEPSRSVNAAPAGAAPADSRAAVSEQEEAASR